MLSEQEFTSWTPNQFDSYLCPADWALESKTRQSAHIETWEVNSHNTSRLFAAVYGSERLNERLIAVEDLRALHVRDPRKYTLPFARGAWGTPNHRWIQEIEESTNLLRLHANVERPTFDQLKAIGMTIGPAAGVTIFRFPATFNLRGPNGYFQTEIVRKMNAEKELADRYHYRNKSTRNANTRTGAVGDFVGLPGPPMTAVERRLAGASAPVDKAGKKL